MGSGLNQLGKGVYAVAEAARLARIAPATARRWFLGRPDSESGPVLSPHYRPVGSAIAVSFLDLVDLLVVGRFRERGVPLQTVRRVYRRLRERMRHENPFSDQKLLTDGRLVFIEWCDDFGDAELEEVLTGQHAFPEVLRKHLVELDYESATGLAKRWRIDDGVVLDPTRNFGKPIVDEFGIGTRVLAASYAANEDENLVGDLFGVTPTAVLQAVAFERRLAA